MSVVAQLPRIAVIGSGIALAPLMGYLANPGMWVWAALGIAAALRIIDSGPLHLTATGMAVELSADDPDNDGLDQLIDRLLRWGLLQTVLLLAIIATMTGLRGV